MGDGIHSNVYMRTVWERLTGAAENLPFGTAKEVEDGAAKIRDTLQKIAKELAEDKFPVKDPPT